MTFPDGEQRSVLLLVNADVTDVTTHAPRGSLGPSRRADFYEMARVLDADVIDWSYVERHLVLRIVRRLSNWYLAASLAAVARHRHYKLIWALTEAEGSLVALALKMLRARTPLLVIGIEPLSPAMKVLLKWMRVYTHISKLLVTNSHSLDTLRSAWGFPADKLDLLPYQVDTEFFSSAWSSGTHPARRFILAVGREARDYATLISAIENLDVDVRIALGSLWAPVGDDDWQSSIPENVSLVEVDYCALRDLYGEALFVVIPLVETPVQNGITALQEAMSMGKAVIVTRTVGQSDLVADDMIVLRDGSGRATVGNLAYLFVPDQPDLHGPTGIYVAPGDVGALRAAIERLLGDEELVEAMGRRARRVAECVVSIDCFIERIVSHSSPFLQHVDEDG